MRGFSDDQAIWKKLNNQTSNQSSPPDCTDKSGVNHLSNPLVCPRHDCCSSSLFISSVCCFTLTIRRQPATKHSRSWRAALKRWRKRAWLNLCCHLIAFTSVLGSGFGNCHLSIWVGSSNKLSDFHEPKVQWTASKRLLKLIVSFLERLVSILRAHLFKILKK